MLARPLSLVALIALPVLAGCGVRSSQAGSNAAADTPATAVKVTAVALRTMPRTVGLTGTLLANRESAVAANASGKVAATFVERGDRVAAGAPLAKLDRRSAALMEEEARSQAAAADAQQSQAALDCDRAANLYAGGAIHKAEHDRLQTQCRATSFAARAAKARRDIAGKALGDQIVRAPFAGVVAERFVSDGEYVRPESRVATIVELDVLRLELSVPEHALSAVTAGREVRFRVAAWPAASFTGRVRFVGATVRRASRDVLVEAMVPNQDGRLRPGMFAVADLALGTRELPVIPASAVRPSDGGGPDRVFVIAAGHAEERLVQLGAREGDVVVALGGLRAGEQVVVSPDPKLRDGAAVTATR